MSLVLNALPDQRSQIESLQRALQEKIEENYDLREELRQERQKRSAMESGALALRLTLNPLFTALQQIYGQIDSMDIAAPGAVPVTDAKKKVWDSWKQKLGGLTGEAIEVLLVHGPMTTTQLRIQLKCATRSATDVVYKLNRAGLITKAGGKITLKEI